MSMIPFIRNKVVTVSRPDDAHFSIFGILDDDMYGLTLQATVRIADLTITKARVRWHRTTTPECVLAVGFLENAVGLSFQEGFDAIAHKKVGRTSCRHFANLLVEMMEAAAAARTRLNWEAASAETPGLTLRAFIENGGALLENVPATAVESAEEKPTDESPPKATPKPSSPAIAHRRPDGEGMLIDLHTHTFPASPCSAISVDALIAEAGECGLDGICITDHNIRLSAGEAADLTQKHGFLVLPGMELTTDQGHVLVFGFSPKLPEAGLVRLADIYPDVDAAGGFIIAAHPFRGFLAVDVTDMGLSVEKAAARPMFNFVHAVETGNGKVTADENAFALQVAGALGKPALAGSDAHASGEVGKHATWFPGRIQGEKDLIAALHGGGFQTVSSIA